MLDPKKMLRPFRMIIEAINDICWQLIEKIKETIFRPIEEVF